jgi:23S rRNA (guanine745-N1)-methyltransferase
MFTADPILKCPVCEDPLTLGAESATCPQSHTFDIARTGYLNLLLPNKKHSREPGDSPSMMRSRRAFLQAGFYDRMASATTAAVAEMLSGREHANMADFGCGEGFFLAGLKHHLSRETTRPCGYFGVDISRTGIRMATTYDRNVTWVVASLHESPFLPQSFDVALSMCAPIAVADLRRVVRHDGALVTVTPGPDHLDALRALIYPSVVPHSPTPALMAGDAHFKLSGSSRVRYPVAVNSREDISNLLAMTPYYWNISRETKALVDACSRLDLTVDVYVSVFRPR